MSWTDSFREAWDVIAGAAIAYAPGILLAILVLIVGWITARLVRSGVVRIVAAANRLLQGVWQRKALPGLPMMARIGGFLANLAFVLVISFALLVALDVAGFDAAVAWFRALATYLPNAITGLVIILLGYPLGVMIRQLITQPATERRAPQYAELGRYVQYAVIVVAIVVGLDQMGVEVRLLVALVTVVVAAVAVSFAVAFTASARSHLGNLIGARTARRQLSPGTAIRIDGIEGTVLEVTATQIAVETSEGRALVPASVIDENVLVILATDADESAPRG